MNGERRPRPALGLPQRLTVRCVCVWCVCVCVCVCVCGCEREHRPLWPRSLSLGERERERQRQRQRQRHRETQRERARETDRKRGQFMCKDPKWPVPGLQITTTSTRCGIQQVKTGGSERPPSLRGRELTVLTQQAKTQWQQSGNN